MQTKIMTISMIMMMTSDLKYLVSIFPDFQTKRTWPIGNIKRSGAHLWKAIYVTIFGLSDKYNRCMTSHSITFSALNKCLDPKSVINTCMYMEDFFFIRWIIICIIQINRINCPVCHKLFIFTDKILIWNNIN